MADKLGMLSWTSSYTRYVWCFICPNIIVVSHFETTFLDSHFEELGSCLLASCDIHFSWQPLDDFPQCHVSRLPSQPCTLCPTSRQILQQTVPYLTPHFHSQPASSCFPRLAGIRPFFSGSYTHLPYLWSHRKKGLLQPSKRSYQLLQAVSIMKGTMATMMLAYAATAGAEDFVGSRWVVARAPLLCTYTTRTWSSRGNRELDSVCYCRAAASRLKFTSLLSFIDKRSTNMNVWA